MLYIVAAAAAAIFSAIPAQAAVVDLTYELTLQVTDTYFQNHYYDDANNDEWGGVDYPGPEVGHVFYEEHHLTVYTDVPQIPGCWYTWACSSYYGFDPETGAVGYTSFDGDNSLYFELFADGTGTWTKMDDYYTAGLVYSVIEADVLDWSVDGLPEVAPVPLPASLPLLAVGVGAFAAIKRKRRQLLA